MKVDLVRIGNSRGVRIPKPIIEQCGFGPTVELLVENDRVIIAPERRLRQGWEATFRSAGAKRKDKQELEGLPPSRFDREEWEW